MWFSVSIPPERRYTGIVRDVIAHVAGDAGCAAGEAAGLADTVEASLGRLVDGLLAGGHEALVCVDLSVEAGALALTVSCDEANGGVGRSGWFDPGRYWDREALLRVYDRFDTLIDNGVPKCRLTRVLCPAHHS